MTNLHESIPLHLHLVARFSGDIASFYSIF
jgi:hypothetical protein